jgi:predicted tellurium resistance membrane protein TerC
MRVLRRVTVGIVVLTAVNVAVGALMAMSQLIHRLPKGVTGVRMLAVAYVLCDILLGSSLVALLLMRVRLVPAWFDRRPRFSDTWVWYLLMALTVLCYAGLAPTFLILLRQVQR